MTSKLQSTESSPAQSSITEKMLTTESSYGRGCDNSWKYMYLTITNSVFIFSWEFVLYVVLLKFHKTIGHKCRTMNKDDITNSVNDGINEIQMQFCHLFNKNLHQRWDSKLCNA